MNNHPDAGKKGYKQSEILLSLSNAIARIHGKEDMLHFIRTTIKQYINFSDSLILRYNKNDSTFHCYIYNTEKSSFNGNRFINYGHIEYSLTDDPLEKSHVPIVYKVASMSPAGDQSISYLTGSGIKEFVSIKLIERNELIGTFILLAQQNKSFSSQDLDFLKQISYQISIATANIIANEEIAKREEEKTLLISLSNEIASLRNRYDLLRIVNTKLKMLFSINEFGIANINADQVTYSAFALDLDDKIKKHSDFEYITSARYNISDQIFSAVVGSSDPVIFNVTELAGKEGMPPYVGFWESVGLQFVLGIALRVGGSNIGCAFLHLDPSSINNIKVNLLKGVCSQLAVAISNILASEEIIRKEEERAFLLSLSIEINAARDNNSLLGVINNKVKKRLLFTDTLIATINEDNITASKFSFEPESISKVRYSRGDLQTGRYPVDDGFMNKAFSSESPVVFDLKEINGDKELPFYLRVNADSGILQVVITRILKGEKVIGFWMIFFDRKVNLDNSQAKLIEGLSTQMSIAVCNIKAAEELQRRESEKSRLLAFSNALASAQEKRVFANILKQQLNELFSIDNFIIQEVNSNGTKYRPILFDAEAVFSKNPFVVDLVDGSYDLNDCVINKVLESENPVTFQVEDWFNLPEVPVYALATKNMGIETITGIRMCLRQTNIAFMMFTINDLVKFTCNRSLLKSICSQIAIAVSNIIAGDDILSREAEKSRLLEFSNAIASVKEKTVLANILKQQLKEIFDIENYIIHFLNNEKTTYSPILYDHEAIFAKRPDFIKMVNSINLVNDGVFNRVLASENPVTFNVEDWFDLPIIPVYANRIKELGVQLLTGIRIRLGQENIAFMMFTVSEPGKLNVQASLLKSICSQIAIAVSNIMANEEIQGREEEKTRLLEFSNVIASVRDKSILGKILKQQLIDLFSIEDYMIVELVNNNKSFIPLLYDPEEVFVVFPAFQNLLQTATAINNGFFRKVLFADDPVTFNTSEILKYSNSTEYLDAAIAIGLKQMTGIRIRMVQEDIAILVIRHDNFTLSAEQYRLLNCICSQIAITVSNIIANEKVNNQLNEINKYKGQLEQEKIYLKDEIEKTNNYSEIIGASFEMKNVYHLVAQVAPSDSTVLILGETGTGKELVARAIHNSSPRKNKLMVKVNCAALPANLIESELFGHERGSFTGATDRRVGKFELANNGTLFLDEIGEMPLELQVKLLRVLQEKEIERVGGKAIIKIDVRIIAATNRDLVKSMEEGKFRSDLFYRLNIFPIDLPPLRNRRQDIPALASHFIRMFSKKTGKNIKNISNKVLQELTQYNWPGNIRELEHLIERKVLLTSGDTINEIDLPPQKSKRYPLTDGEDFTIKTLDENERHYILKILKHCHGRISGQEGAAFLLGLPPSTLNSKIRRLGIKKDTLFKNISE